MTVLKFLLSSLLSSTLSLSLAGTEDLLTTVLLLGSLWLADLVDLFSHGVSDETVTWLKLLQSFVRIVDQTETSGFTTTELGSHAEDGDGVLLGFVDSGEFLTELVLGDVSSAWVQNVDDELTTAQKWVSDELSGADGNSVALNTFVSH